ENAVSNQASFNDISNILNEMINSPQFGLNEIKNEIRFIENAVSNQSCNNISNILNQIINSPQFGLNEIKNEIRAIENEVFNEQHGLQEIKNEIRLLVNEIPGQSNCVTTGAVIRDVRSTNLVFKVLNSTPNEQKVTMIVWNYDTCPSICYNTVEFTTLSNCANDTDILLSGQIPGPGSQMTNLKDYEITVCGIVPGVYVFAATYASNTSFSNIYRSGDFLPVIYNRTCP
ncbi:MAG: hypothetical protein LLG02_07575, partial [Pelosinus sp.]|nr:hypothetical protein [Pelosinus sp.]